MLALTEVAPLGEMLADPDTPKIFHAADYDVRALHRDFGFHVRGLCDTAIGAQFLGAERTGLANVLSARLGISLDKPKRLQRLDWSHRPMPPDALEYAAGDVAYLLPLYDDIQAELGTLNRLDWVREEWQRMEAVRFVPPEPPETAFFGVPGARDLSGKGRAVLRELFVMREAEALATGKPPYRVLANASLISLATQAAESVPFQMPRVPPSVREKLLDAMARGAAADPVPWPRSRGRNPWDAASRRRLLELKKWRTEAALRLGLDAGIIWPLSHLKRIALEPGADPHSLASADDPCDVRQWQWRELGSALEAAVRALGTGASGPQLGAELPL